MCTVIRYARERFNEYQQELAYRIYCTNALKLIAENTRNFAGGAAPTANFFDIIHGNTAVKQMDADKIIDSVVENAGLTMIGGED